MGKKESDNYHSTHIRHPESGGVIRVTKLHQGKPLPIEVIRSLCHDTTDEHAMIGPAGHSDEKTARVLEEIQKRGVPEDIIPAIQINGHATFATGIVVGYQPFLAIIEKHPPRDRVTHTITVVNTNHEPLRTTPAR